MSVQSAMSPAQWSEVGARERFLAFYDESVDPLFTYLYRATGGDRELAEDLAQDVFAVALRRVHAGDLDVMTIPWVITVGRNRFIDHCRRKARWDHRAAVRVVEVTEPDSTDDALAWLSGLPPLQRAAVALRYIDDLPVRDVAHRLGKGTRATESLIARALRTLRTTERPFDA